MKEVDIFNEADFHQNPTLVFKFLIKELETLSKQMETMNDRLNEFGKLETKIEKVLAEYKATQECCEEALKLKDEIKELEAKVIVIEKDIEQTKKIGGNITSLAQSVSTLKGDIREVSLKLRQVENTLKGRGTLFSQILMAFLTSLFAFLIYALLGGLMHYLEKTGKVG